MKRWLIHLLLLLPVLLWGREEPAVPFVNALYGDNGNSLLKLSDWTAGSVLATGDWYRISVENSGIHKLTYAQLQEIGLQNPATVRIYGSGASLLPEAVAANHMDDLSPVAFYMDKGSDALFGPGDFILFYAQGPVRWNYSSEAGMFLQKLHPYSLEGYYFITDDMGPAVSPGDAELSQSDPGFVVTSYDFRDFIEEETYNLISSGKEWFGDNFNVNLDENYVFTIPERVPGEPVSIRVEAAARSSVISAFNVSVDNTLLGSVEIPRADLSTYTATYAYQEEEIFSADPAMDYFTLTLLYNRPNSDAQGWLNSIAVNGRSRLSLEEAQLPFRDSRSAGEGNISEFRVEECNSRTVIWEITEPDQPVTIPFSLNGSTAQFRLATDEIREFIAFDADGAFPAPRFSGEGTGRVDNQDLHSMESPDMVILTPGDFLEQAEQLAQHRREHDGLNVAVVQQQQVFNEFSSGTPDVAAIRNFMKMFYDRAEGSENYCRYLLMMGDGSYDNRSVTDNNPNRLLTYQSDESLSPTRSYVSDDFFGMLDSTDTMYSGLLNIGIGRLPVSTVEEAETLVSKLIAYDDPANQGAWRNQLCFIGDDEDANVHMKQAEELSGYVQEHYPAYNINKIYLDAYLQENLATGPKYPEVTRAINNQINRGALIVNYTGHGGTLGLAHERITTKNDIGSWENDGMFPLFMTATCEFSRYDEYDHKQDQEVTSAGEEVLLNSQGGGIGLFTTTRLVYSGPNHTLNERFYEVVFEKDENQENYRLGDIILYSKNNTGAGYNKRNFTLLGDPSMRLAYPQHRVVTDSINGKDVALETDTLSAFQWVTVSGHIESQSGTLLEDYNGTIYPLVYDKEKQVETLSNDDEPVLVFKSRNNILYSGNATVSGGRFSFGFYVPKDINYAIGEGKISYYSNNPSEDAHGSCMEFRVGGIGTENVTDLEAPVIEVYMNDTHFKSGGITDPDPTLLVYASDNFGINTTGNGIGHDLTATLDDDHINSVILNEFYQANTDSYNSGIIRYPYSLLEEGRHRVTVKIWDIHNNSAESTLEFVVMDSEEMLLENLLNFPNPFVEETWFSIEHNRPDRELRMVLSIYNLAGEMVRIIDRRVYSAGYRLDPVAWDGTTSGGDRLGGGVYLYRVTLETDEGEVAAGSGKLIISR